MDYMISNNDCIIVICCMLLLPFEHELNKNVMLYNWNPLISYNKESVWVCCMRQHAACYVVCMCGPASFSSGPVFMVSVNIILCATSEAGRNLERKKRKIRMVEFISNLYLTGPYTIWSNYMC